MNPEQSLYSDKNIQLLKDEIADDEIDIVQLQIQIERKPPNLEELKKQLSEVQQELARRKAILQNMIAGDIGKQKLE